MQKVLVSSCLLGLPVRYHGGGGACFHPILAQWMAEGRVVAVCPELAGGLATPRPPAEIEGGQGGRQVLQGRAQVVDQAGRTGTTEFVVGARETLKLAQAQGITLAVLKEGSPSCGSGYTYDGRFRGRRVPLAGVQNS